MEGEQIILEEELDENYEPTEQGGPQTPYHCAPRLGAQPWQRSAPLPPRAACGDESSAWAADLRSQPILRTSEILDYANWLGMDVDTERVRGMLARWQLAATPKVGWGQQRVLRSALRQPSTHPPWQSLARGPGRPSPLQDLLWIAREGLKAQLPKEWKPW